MLSFLAFYIFSVFFSTFICYLSRFCTTYCLFLPVSYCIYLNKFLCNLPFIAALNNFEYLIRSYLQRSTKIKIEHVDFVFFFFLHFSPFYRLCEIPSLNINIFIKKDNTYMNILIYCLYIIFNSCTSSSSKI